MHELLRNPDSFYKILELTVSTLNLDEMMTKVMDELRELFDCDRCTLYVVDAKANELYTQVAQKSNIGNFRIPLDRNHSLSSFVAITGRDICIDDVYNDAEMHAIDPNLNLSHELDKRNDFTTKQVISVPLKIRGEIIGVLQAINKPGGFLKKDLDAMKEFSLILALALKNALVVKAMTGRAA